MKRDTGVLVSDARVVDAVDASAKGVSLGRVALHADLTKLARLSQALARAREFPLAALTLR